MFTVPESISRVNTFARAVCSKELYKIFYSRNIRFNFVIIALTIVIPFVCLVMLILLIRNVQDDSIKMFTQPSKHGVLVAMVMNGILASAAILIFDILACYVVVSNYHEYSEDLEGSSLNMYIVFGTLICDLLFFIPQLFSIIYIMVFNAKRLIKICCKRDIEFSMRYPTDYFIKLLIGKRTLSKIQNLSKSDNDAIAVIFSSMLVTPLLCFSSHIGYIMLAWLTEPSKCTTILIIFYIIFVYFFLAFRKCYKHFARRKISLKCLNRRMPTTHDSSSVYANTGFELTECPSNGEEQSIQHRDEREVDDMPVVLDNSSSEEQNKGGKEDDSYDCCFFSVVKVDKEYLNTQAFCLQFFFAFFFLSLLVMMIAIIIILPLSSEELVTYLFNIFQLMVVIISTQVAYDLYFGSSFSTKDVFEKFRELFALKKNNNYNQNFVAIAQNRAKYSEINDAVGAFAAEFTDVIIKKVHTD